MNKDNKESVQIAVDEELKEQFEKDNKGYIGAKADNVNCQFCDECDKSDCKYYKIEYNYWLENQVKPQADRIKQLDEDWKELDSDCMILHDKNKQLEAENKELKEKVEWIADIHNNLLPKYDKLEKEKTDILDKVKKVILNWHNDYTDTIQIDELIKEIDKLKGV
jgi:predicted transcriptional regulator